MMFRCKLDECGEEFEDEGDMGMHLMWAHDLAEGVTGGKVITREMRKKRAIEQVAELDKNIEIDRKWR